MKLRSALKSSTAISMVLVGVSPLALASSAGAADQFWDGAAGNTNNGVINGGSGTWDPGTSTNWTDAGDTSAGTTWQGASSTAVFSGAAGTVIVNGIVPFGGLRFETAGYVLAGAGLDHLTTHLERATVAAGSLQMA